MTQIVTGRKACPAPAEVACPLFPELCAYTVMAQAQLSPDQMFLTHLPAIDGIARAAARRRRLTTDEAEEFRSIVRLRLIENDYAVIREFRGSSSFRTFL